MPPQLLPLFAGQGGVATYRQIREVIGRRVMERLVRDGHLVKIWPGIYSGAKPSALTRLRGLDLRCGEPVAVCLHTAAAVHGFDTEQSSRLHVLNPRGYQLRDDDALAVHRREGVPLTTVRGRLVTPPAWTAVEVARGVGRPRALATLDAALRSQTCDVPGLWRAAEAQAARRGIVTVRELIPWARPQAESPMESEARLMMLDGGLPEPELQLRIVDREGVVWRVDFAWPGVIVEYDGYDWHKTPEQVRRDHRKRAALEEMGYRVLSIVSEDVRGEPARTVRRIGDLLGRAAA